MVTGLLVVAPLYLSILPMLKVMNSVRSLVKPLAFFFQAIKAVSHWGQGLKELAAAMGHYRDATAESGNALPD